MCSFDDTAVASSSDDTAAVKKLRSHKGVQTVLRTSWPSSGPDNTLPLLSPILRIADVSSVVTFVYKSDASVDVTINCIAFAVLACLLKETSKRWVYIYIVKVDAWLKVLSPKTVSCREWAEKYSKGM